MNKIIFPLLLIYSAITFGQRPSQPTKTTETVDEKQITDSKTEQLTNEKVVQENTKAKKNSFEENTVTLTVSGTGKTLEDAKLNALRSAIEQAFGTFISSKTEILNDNLIKDEIVSVANGNIQKYEIVSEEEVSSSNYLTILVATVSIDNLASFIESKGGSAELKGSLLGYNLKIKDLEKESELKAFENLNSTYKKYLEVSFDYSVLIISEPKMISENEVAIRIKANGKFNENIEKFTSYFFKTLRAVSLDLNSVGAYQSLNVPLYSIYIVPCVAVYTNKKGKEKKIKYEQLFVFRNKETLNRILELLDIEKYAENFKIKNEIKNIDGSILFNESKVIYASLPVFEIKRLRDSDRRPLIFTQTDFSSDYRNNQLKRKIQFSNYFGIYRNYIENKLICIGSPETSIFSMDQINLSIENARKDGGEAGVSWILSLYSDSYLKYGFIKDDKYPIAYKTIRPYLFNFEYLKENKPVFSIEFYDFIKKDDLTKINGYTISK